MKEGTQKRNLSEQSDDSNKKRKLEENAPINSLISEVRELIFSRLALKDLANAQLTCQQWNTEIRNNNFWRFLIRQEFPYLRETHADEYEKCPRDIYLPVYTRHKFVKSHIAVLTQGYNFTEADLFASFRGDLEEIKNSQLLAEGDRYALYSFAIANGHYTILKDKDNSEKEKLEKVAFKYAAQIGNLEVLKYLLDENKNKIQSPISRMIFNTNTGPLSLLYLAISSIDSFDSYIDYGLISAASNGHLNVVRFILQECPNLSPDSKMSAFEHAVKNGHVHIIKYLLDNGETTVHNAIHIAIQRENIEVLKYILSLPAPLIISEDLALEQAARYGKKTITEYLLKEMPNISLDAKKTAKDLANSQGFTEIAELISNNIKVNRPCVLM